ncbi:unnamed protein product, partial [Prorocentrum cordatum]
EGSGAAGSERPRPPTHEESWALHFLAHARKAADAGAPPEGPPLTLAGSLRQAHNRRVARLLAGFMAALAVVPVVGLLACERLLRGLVPDDATRLTYSGALAVLLVNLVMASYVLWCFLEDDGGATDQKGAGSLPTDVKAGAASSQGQEPKQVSETKCGDENVPPKEAKKHI